MGQGGLQAGVRAGLKKVGDQESVGNGLAIRGRQGVQPPAELEDLPGPGRGGHPSVPAAGPLPPQPFNCLTSSGTTWNRSPTMPKWATSKMGACGSELMATMMSEPFMPARCWMAPEMPQAK